MFTLLSLLYWFLCFVFFFKQKTAYEMRISDWSSDVCSSDLISEQHGQAEGARRRARADRSRVRQGLGDEIGLEGSHAGGGDLDRIARPRHCPRRRRLAARPRHRNLWSRKLGQDDARAPQDRKSTRLNSSH